MLVVLPSSHVQLHPARRPVERGQHGPADRDDEDSARPGDAFSTLALQPEQQLATAIAEVRAIMSGPSIQARCLECPSDVPARIEQKDLTLLELIRSWLG